ncbi:hypothetical protein BDP27DRAFT_1320786 [Rhodocollybia butyracea]|uniref:Uncharacterized protein n=1 Tax=Rhodocollybia butyracea TaxID=206335 RepID=A0A9P5PZP5_9AGAR|nr:hypothetical protein BDP27DRAFT_1320786 [Rhodocollybia butyracea]
MMVWTAPRYCLLTTLFSHLWYLLRQDRTGQDRSYEEFVDAQDSGALNISTPADLYRLYPLLQRVAFTKPKRLYTV